MRKIGNEVWSLNVEPLNCREALNDWNDWNAWNGLFLVTNEALAIERLELILGVTWPGKKLAVGARHRVFLKVSGSMALRPPTWLFEHFEVSRIPETF